MVTAEQITEKITVARADLIALQTRRLIELLNENRELRKRNEELRDQLFRAKQIPPTRGALTDYWQSMCPVWIKLEINEDTPGLVRAILKSAKEPKQ